MQRNSSPILSNHMEYQGASYSARLVPSHLYGSTVEGDPIAGEAGSSYLAASAFAKRDIMQLSSASPDTRALLQKASGELSA